VGKSAVGKSAGAKAAAAKSAVAKSAVAKSAVAKSAVAEAAIVAKAVIAKAAIAKAAEGKTPARARASAARSSDAKRSATERPVESAAIEPVAVVEAPATPPHAKKISAPTNAIEQRVETARQEMGEKKIGREKEIGQQSGREHSPEISHETSTAVAAAGVTGETRITTTSRESAPHIDIEHSDASSPSVAPIAGASEPNAAASVSPPASSETIPVPKQTQGKAINAKSSPAPTAPMSAAASSALSPKAIVAARTAAAAPIKQPIPPAVKAKTSAHKLGFKTHEFVVYPAHGVGQIVAIETQEVAGFSLELFVVSFIKDKMTLKVPTSKVATVGMRKLAETEVVDKALSTLTGRARVKRTMWSRRAQEYEAKINSGDLVTIAEVVRDLYRSDTQPEQSYSERQLYEAALDRMAREVAAVRKLLDSESLKLIESFLQKGPRRGGPKGDAEADASDDASEEGEEDDVEERAA
jgi:CarD family transcriptional regulator